MSDTWAKHFSHTIHMILPWLYEVGTIINFTDEKTERQKI